MRKNLSADEKIEKSLNRINNVNPNKADEIKRQIGKDFVNKSTLLELDAYIRKEILFIDKPLNRSTKEYWIKRGWSELEAQKKYKEYSKQYRANCSSPFSPEHWIKKGYTKEQAEYIRNSKRPIRKEYWLERGYTEEEAISKAKETKSRNDKKGGKTNSEKPLEQLQRQSPKCVIYWTDRGYTEDEAKDIIAESQKTFTLDKCIEKYGEEIGTRIHRERQIKWQKTLNSKSKEELEKIRKSKNAILLDKYSSVQECVEDLKKTRNMTLFDSIEAFEESFVNDTLVNYPYMKYYPVQKIMDGIPKVQKEILGYDDLFEVVTRHLDSEKLYLLRKSNKQAFRKWTDDGLLRSSFEIYFYDKFKSLYPDKPIKVDKCYPNSNFRYDFMIDGIFIEICPMIESNSKYAEKMMKKQKAFDCVLLKSIEEIDAFLEGLS